MKYGRVDPEFPVFDLAAALRFCRERAGLSRRKAAALAGLSDAYVSKVEASNLDPSLRAFGRLALAIGMNPDEIAVVVLALGNHSPEEPDADHH